MSADNSDRSEIPERGDLAWGTIPAALADVAARSGDREAIVDGDTRLTWAEVAQRTTDVARALIARGIRPGDRVAIWAPNVWEWVVALIGSQSVGAVIVPLNTRYKGIEAADIIRRSEATALFTVEGFLGTNYVSMLEAAAPDVLAGLGTVVVMRGEASGGALSWQQLLDAGTDVDPADVAERIAALTADDLSDIIFTSGTTGQPKGVMCTHGQTLRGFADWARIVGLRADDRYLVINPFFHSFGYKAGIIAGVVTGCTLIPLATFDVAEAAKMITAEHVSMIPGPPTIYQTLLNDPRFDPAALSSLRLAVTGAAAIPVKLVEDMRDVLGFETVVTAYGLSEACGIATVCRHDDDPETIATTSGRAIPGVEVRCAGPDGQAMPVGEPGEVWVRGYNVMLGYLDDPAQTAEAIDSDGWLHTGDVGTLDDRGYLRITDRVKDMFIVGGFNAYPAEIESLLLAQGGLAQVAVVGVPDDRMGEVGFAFAIPKAGTTIEGADVVAWARENMANYKAPRHVEIVDSLPLNASGKVLKFELRERAISARAQSGEGPSA